MQQSTGRRYNSHVADKLNRIAEADSHREIDPESVTNIDILKKKLRSVFNCAGHNISL